MRKNDPALTVRKHNESKVENNQVTRIVKNVLSLIFVQLVIL